MKTIRTIQCLLLCLLLPAALRADEPKLPPEAVLLSTEKEVVLSKPKTEDSDIVSVESGGAPVNPVWRATSAEKLAKPYELALNKKFLSVIAKDQFVFL